MKFLVTGAGGFIGFHVCKRLIKEGFDVTGLDNLNDYYSVSLKKNRLTELGIEQPEKGIKVTSAKDGSFGFYHTDLVDRAAMDSIFKSVKPDLVIHLAAQAGVRYSLENPHSYINSNVAGFLNVIEGCRHHGVDHLIYASSSSVYGDNSEVPFQTTQQLDRPVSLYAATKKANELMAYTYSHLYGIPSTGLRFFTVYGPWGRPDMAYFKFADLMTSGKQIDVYNHGDMYRDFTYVDDIVESIFRLTNKPPEGDDPYRLLNIGYGSPVKLLTFIELLENMLGTDVEKNYLPMQPGDVPRTWADTAELRELTGYTPQISLEDGIREFVAWYQEYH